MKNVLTPIAKIVLIPLGLTAATSATDAAIKKKNVCIWDDCTDNLERRNRW